ncbi:sugar transferase, partial [Campylobacter sp. RM10543]|nr:sugar transferase [Campylobacter sp. RM10543]
GAPARVKKHLAYKLGQAMIENSKSILGCIRMPFVLMKIYTRYKKEQKTYRMLINVNSNLLLPKLKEYADYKEALKLKEHLSYKLGQALIKANKNW